MIIVMMMIRIIIFYYYHRLSLRHRDAECPRSRPVRKLKEKYWSVLENVQIGPSRPFGYDQVAGFDAFLLIAMLHSCVRWPRTVLAFRGIRNLWLAAPRKLWKCLTSSDWRGIRNL